ncbi:MAG: pilus assembly protein [Pseudomonadota bacterium]|nr:pilus assembly protein [Pseudomonadota bacterium]
MTRPRSQPSASIRRRGSAALEFALCLPIFVLIVAAIADLSTFVAVVQLASRAARDGARVGSTVIEGATPNGDLIEAEAIEHVELLLAEAGRPCGAGCTVQAEWLDIEGRMFVRVRVEYPYEPLVGLSTFLSDNVRAEFTMMTQQQP